MDQRRSSGAALAAEMPTAETFAFEALVPGPAEELVFRGVGFALLMRMFRRGEVDRRAVASGLIRPGRKVHIVRDDLQRTAGSSSGCRYSG